MFVEGGKVGEDCPVGEEDLEGACAWEGRHACQSGEKGRPLGVSEGGIRGLPTIYGAKRGAMEEGIEANQCVCCRAHGDEEA